jgi:hypothetical protein
MIKATQQDIKELKETWEGLFPGTPLSDTQFFIWVVLNDPEIVKQGMVTAARKYLKLEGKMDREYAIRFASRVMNRLTDEKRRAL